MNPLRLEQMTIFDVPPEDVVDIAAEFGIPLVSFFTVEGMPGARPVSHLNKHKLLERLRDTPVKVDAVEVFMLRPDPKAFEGEIALAAELGAGTITALNISSHDEQEAADNLAALCSLADSYALRVNLEPISMGQTRTVTEAARLIRLSGAANLGMTLDLLHIVRTGTPLSDVASLDRTLISGAQVCDGPLTPPLDLVEEASNARGVPGSGTFPIAAFLDLLPADIPLGLEVPLKPLRDAGISARDRTRLVVEAMRAFS